MFADSRTNPSVGYCDSNPGVDGLFEEDKDTERNFSCSTDKIVVRRPSKTRTAKLPGSDADLETLLFPSDDDASRVMTARSQSEWRDWMSITDCQDLGSCSWKSDVQRANLINHSISKVQKSDDPPPPPFISEGAPGAYFRTVSRVEEEEPSPAVHGGPSARERNLQPITLVSAITVASRSLPACGDRSRSPGLDKIYSAFGPGGNSPNGLDSFYRAHGQESPRANKHGKGPLPHQRHSHQQLHQHMQQSYQRLHRSYLHLSHQDLSEELLPPMDVAQRNLRRATSLTTRMPTFRSGPNVLNKNTMTLSSETIHRRTASMK
eukprot:gene27360-4662_t